jgi:hypothetical protein
MHDEETQALKAAQSILRLLDEGRARTGLSRHPFFTQALRVWEATSRLADMDEFLNEACVGVEKAVGEISQAFSELLYQASRNYHDVLGMTYMLAQLGSRGEEYTPTSIARLLVRLTMGDLTPPPPGGPPLTIYDPCCGSGSLLLGAAEYIEERHPDLLESGLARFYGQEISYDAWLMAKLNMRLHGLTRRIWQPQQLSEEEQLAIEHLTASPGQLRAGLFSLAQQKGTAASPARKEDRAAQEQRPERTAPAASGLLYVTVQPLFPPEEDGKPAGDIPGTLRQAETREDP